MSRLELGRLIARRDGLDAERLRGRQPGRRRRAGPIDVRLDSSLAAEACSAPGCAAPGSSCHDPVPRPPRPARSSTRHGRPASGTSTPRASTPSGRCASPGGCRRGPRGSARPSRRPSRPPSCSPTGTSGSSRSCASTSGRAGWLDDFADRVRAAFADPATPAAPGWEPLEATRERLLPAVRRILDVHGDDDVVLVGHGTAWTLLVAALTGQRARPGEVGVTRHARRDRGPRRPTMSAMSTPETTETQPRVEPTDEAGWWHRSHPTFAGDHRLLRRHAVRHRPAGRASPACCACCSPTSAPRSCSRSSWSPWCCRSCCSSRRKTRRFAIFMVIGMVVTALVVLGVTSLVLYFMVQYDVT